MPKPPPPTMTRGRFVVLEGPDGAGKSVQAAGLADALRARGRRVVATREPGGTPLGEAIRGLLLDHRDEARDPATDALLFNAARAELVRTVVRPALERGDVVVSDRFADSTLAYQGYGSGVPLERLRELERFATGGLRPDVVLLLDLPVREGLARRTSGSPTELTRFERAADHGEAFHERVRRGFLELASAEPDRWRIIDADRAVETVAADVLRALDTVLGPEIGPESVERSEPIGVSVRITG